MDLIEQAADILMRTPETADDVVDPIYRHEAREFARALHTAGMLHNPEDGAAAHADLEQLRERNKRLNAEAHRNGVRATEEFGRAEAALAEAEDLRARIDKLLAAHEKSLFPISTGELRGIHHCIGCTQGMDEHILYIPYPCPIRKVLTEPVTDTTPESPSTPNGCRWCGIAKDQHYQQWLPETGWHGWVPPTGEQRKERMLARRAAANTLKDKA